MKNILSILALSLGLFACQQEGRIYVDHQELSPNIEWLQKDKREFKVPIEDNSIDYKMSLSFRYASGYQYKVAKVKVTEISPSGKESVNEYDLKVRKDNGDYIGEPGFDIWDSEHVVTPKIKYEETGTYTYVIEHIMPSDPLNFAMEVGVVLDKVGGDN
jgi:gliding motility-associated lipoprotein GldH